MRFFFDSQNDIFEIHDKDGIDLPNVQAARSQAIRALGGILIDLAGKESKGRILVTVRGADSPKSLMRAVAFFDVSEPE